ncbi:hypothetical protein EV182_006022 [Spiromyces aspiralis]|uniref:Uncharacterized protein n=1 Tax=Spiromyces aspiralis TaxID=68401 RepID=A0ACC1HLR5_9FUNG|nr:hypothetical protein EV182_006022 [Spiromyces aspiralis]
MDRGVLDLFTKNHILPVVKRRHAVPASSVTSSRSYRDIDARRYSDKRNDDGRSSQGWLDLGPKEAAADDIGARRHSVNWGENDCSNQGWPDLGPSEDACGNVNDHRSRAKEGDYGRSNLDWPDPASDADAVRDADSHSNSGGGDMDDHARQGWPDLAPDEGAAGNGGATPSLSGDGWAHARCTIPSLITSYRHKDLIDDGDNSQQHREADAGDKYDRQSSPRQQPASPEYGKRRDVNDDVDFEIAPPSSQS